MVTLALGSCTSNCKAFFFHARDEGASSINLLLQKTLFHNFYIKRHDMHQAVYFYNDHQYGRIWSISNIFYSL